MYVKIRTNKIFFLIKLSLEKFWGELKKILANFQKMSNNTLRINFAKMYIKIILRKRVGGVGCVEEKNRNKTKNRNNYKRKFRRNF